MPLKNLALFWESQPNFVRRQRFPAAHAAAPSTFSALPHPVSAIPPATLPFNQLGTEVEGVGVGVTV
jgi:hypothetical protein